MNSEELIVQIRLLEKNDQIDGITYRKLGVKFFNEKNYGLAKEFFYKSFEKSHDLTSYCNYGVVVGKYFQEYENAEKIFCQIIAECESNGQSDVLAMAHYNRACNYVRKKDSHNALADLAKALSIGGSKYKSIAEGDAAFEPIEHEIEFKQLLPDYNPSIEQIT